MKAAKISRKTLPASDVKLNSTGSHIAVNCYGNVCIYRADDLCHDTSYASLGLGHTSFDWSSGTSGVLSYKQEAKGTQRSFGTLHLYYGVLLQSPECAQPWDKLDFTVIRRDTADIAGREILDDAFVGLHLSPDASKVLLVSSLDLRGENVDAYQCMCTVYDICSGNKLWEQVIGETSILGVSMLASTWSGFQIAMQLYAARTHTVLKSSVHATQKMCGWPA